MEATDTTTTISKQQKANNSMERSTTSKAKPNQTQATPWQDLDAHTQRLDIIKVKMTKDLVLMDLQKVLRLSATVQTPSESASTVTRYEFSKKDKTLTVTTQEQEMSNVFTCKPWVQRSWWRLY